MHRKAGGAITVELFTCGTAEHLDLQAFPEFPCIKGCCEAVICVTLSLEKALILQPAELLACYVCLHVQSHCIYLQQRKLPTLDATSIPLGYFDHDMHKTT